MENKNVCISCERECENNHKYCFYCWFRGRVGTARFLLFKAMKSNGNEPVTLKEAWELDCKLRKKIGKEPVRIRAVETILYRYSKHYEDCKEKKKGYLLLKGKRKRRTTKGKKSLGGRPENTYRLSSRLLKRIAKNEEDWRLGFPVYNRMDYKEGIKFKMTEENTLKAKIIANKIRNKEYGLYEHLLPNGLIEQ